MKLDTHVNPAKPAKDWSWSYSKLKNYRVCPKRMYEVDILKSFSDGGGEALLWGNEVHAAVAAALKTGLPLPDTMKPYQYWVDRVRRGSGQLLVEQKYAINRQFQKTGYFANDVWYRGIGDVVRLDIVPGRAKNVALVLDWKTGKILDDSEQLMLMAQCIFSHYPEVTDVRSSFVWLKEDTETPEHLTRQEVAAQWATLLPDVLAMENAAKTLTYPPKPGHLCKNWCPVTSCPFHGKGSRG